MIIRRIYRPIVLINLVIGPCHFYNCLSAQENAQSVWNYNWNQHSFWSHQLKVSVSLSFQAQGQVLKTQTFCGNTVFPCVIKVFYFIIFFHFHSFLWLPVSSEGSSANPHFKSCVFYTFFWSFKSSLLQNIIFTLFSASGYRPLRLFMLFSLAFLIHLLPMVCFVFRGL